MQMGGFELGGGWPLRKRDLGRPSKARNLKMLKLGKLLYIYIYIYIYYYYYYHYYCYYVYIIIIITIIIIIIIIIIIVIIIIAPPVETLTC